MPRAIWTGAISFGLVTIPVRLYSAISEKDVHFHQFKAGTGERINLKRVAGEDEEEVPYEDIVKGYEVSDGEYVMVTPEELESVEPGRSRTIDISDFVDLHEIDPIYFEHTYFLGPQGDVGAERPYALLLEAMKSTEKVAIGSLVMRNKEYLAAIRPKDDVLVLETLYFDDEVRKAEDLDLPRVKSSDKELGMAEQLIESLSASWDPSKYKDRYRKRVLDLIKRKAAGKEIVVEEQPEPEPVVDLMAALEASLREREGGGKAKASPAKGASAKKSAKKKSSRPKTKAAKTKASSSKKRKAG